MRDTRAAKETVTKRWQGGKEEQGEIEKQGAARVTRGTSGAREPRGAGVERVAKSAGAVSLTRAASAASRGRGRGC